MIETLKKNIILHLYETKYRISKYMKQNLIDLKGKAYKSPIIIGDFITPLSGIDRTRG